MKRVRNSLVALALSLSLLVGCSSDEGERPEPKETVTETVTPTPMPEPSAPSEQPDSLESAFLQAVREQIPLLNSVPDATLVSEAQTVCMAYRQAGVTKETLLEGAMAFSRNTEGAVSVEDAAFFIGAAAAVYCPEVGEAIQNLTGGNTI